MRDARKEGSWAILVGAGEDRQIRELGRLAGTLGLEAVGVLEQRRREGVGYIGRGKRKMLKSLVDRSDADLVIVDDELSPSQARVLEKDAGVPVVDRTALIIRIFEAHAKDSASRLEVELAELSYRLPRVKGGSASLSRLGGGVGTRGPGEQQLEYDRRVIRQRMEKIVERLTTEKAARGVRSARMKKGGPPSVVLVGYTNAGKTTILNALSGERRSTADRLFETLEITTRLVNNTSVEVDGAVMRPPDFVLSDTVGFIRKLPTQLVHSFASTLEVIKDADVIVLCADASSEILEEEVRTVEETLSQTFSEDGSLKESVLCLNKADLISEERRYELASSYPGAVLMSASLDPTPLLVAVNEALARNWIRVHLLIPHAEYGAVSGLYGQAEIHTQENTEEGLRLEVTLPKPQVHRYDHYRTA
ncbi:MAG: GTPase HflX [Actinomycetota bacterium]|nr:GTPase HflX [Actinomycetota bacterium]